MNNKEIKKFLDEQANKYLRELMENSLSKVASLGGEPYKYLFKIELFGFRVAVWRFKK